MLEKSMLDFLLRVMYDDTLHWTEAYALLFCPTFVLWVLSFINKGYEDYALKKRIPQCHVIEQMPQTELRQSSHLYATKTFRIW